MTRKNKSRSTRKKRGGSQPLPDVQINIKGGGVFGDFVDELKGAFFSPSKPTAKAQPNAAKPGLSFMKELEAAFNEGLGEKKAEDEQKEKEKQEKEAQKEKERQEKEAMAAEKAKAKGEGRSFLKGMMNKVGLKGDISSGLDNGISQQSQVLNEIQSIRQLVGNIQQQLQENQKQLMDNNKNIINNRSMISGKGELPHESDTILVKRKKVILNEFNDQKNEILELLK